MKSRKKRPPFLFFSSNLTPSCITPSQNPDSPFQTSTNVDGSFSIHDYHIQGSRILSRSFTVPHSRAGRVDVHGGDDDEEKDEDDSDSDDEEEGEEQVMVPLADMLNAAYERDNVSVCFFLWGGGGGLNLIFSVSDYAPIRLGCIMKRDV